MVDKHFGGNVDSALLASSAEAELWLACYPCLLLSACTSSKHGADLKREYATDGHHTRREPLECRHILLDTSSVLLCI